MSSRILLIAVVALAAVQGALAWGPDGHYIIGALATQQLTAGALARCNQILGNATLASVASWADDVKHDSQWEYTSQLHYINTPDWECSFNFAQDCVGDDGAPQACVAGAITNFTSQMVSGSGVGFADALKFVVHFVGDIHQPLHVAFKSDRGGNSISITYEGDNTNLHAIWDTNMLDQRMNTDFNGDRDAFISYLFNQTTPADALPLNVNQWAVQTAGLACKYAYTNSQGQHVQSGDTLGDPYYAFTKSTIDDQLRRAGARLGAWVNNYFKV